MKVIDLINLYRLKDMCRIEIRKNNWFVLEAAQENIPEEIKNKEVYDFCTSDNKLVVNFSSDEVELIEQDKEIEEIETCYYDDEEYRPEQRINVCMNKIDELIKVANKLKKGK